MRLNSASSYTGSFSRAGELIFQLSKSIDEKRDDANEHSAKIQDLDEVIKNSKSEQTENLIKFIICFSVKQNNLNVVDYIWKNHQKIIGSSLDFYLPSNIYIAVIKHRKQGDRCLGKSPLIIAAVHGYIETVQYLLNIGASINYIPHNSPFPKKSSALMEATSAGQTHIVEFLLKSGADTSLTRDSGTVKAAFHIPFWALEKQNLLGSSLAILRLYIKYKADLRNITQKGESLLDCLVYLCRPSDSPLKQQILEEAIYLLLSEGYVFNDHGQPQPHHREVFERAQQRITDQEVRIEAVRLFSNEFSGVHPKRSLTKNSETDPPVVRSLRYQTHFERNLCRNLLEFLPVPPLKSAKETKEDDPSKEAHLLQSNLKC